MSAIVVQDLRLRRGKGFQLGPLSMCVATGQRTALVGPSGCGKTTLLRCLAGLERPDAGTIHLGDRLVEGPSAHVAPAGRNIGMVFQDGALWPHLTALRHLTFAVPGLSRKDALALLDRVGLAAVAKRRPGSLSGGEIQRLALVRALAGNPDLLLLDEPLHSVDAPLRDELSLLIRTVAEERGVTLILVTHDREEALAVADDLVVLRDGHVIETGPAPSLLADPRTAFAASFLGRAACLPATVQDGDVCCVFGTFPLPSNNSTPRRLVLLPGDVSLAREATDAGPHARVLHVLPDGTGWQATLDLEGQVLRVPCDEPISPGTLVTLKLTGAPRFLPEVDVEVTP